MDLVAWVFYALSTALDYGSLFSFTVFFNILIRFLRPDIVDVDNMVSIVPPAEILVSYDFVIIGAGSAGSVLAKRLTENTNWTVLLLEAGGNGSFTDEVPGLVSALQRSEIDWEFATEPSSTYCLAMDNHRCRWPRGKRLGGSSSINNMMYVRGNKKDFDGWRDLGNPGWGYDDVLPYFKKSENMTISSLQNSSYHGTSGEITIEESKYHAAITDIFLAAGVEMGYDRVDINGENQTGFGYVQDTMRDSLRCDVEKAFLRPSSHRSNLDVSTHSRVEKILIDPTTKTAYGVRFSRDGVVYNVNATTEVILSAGALQSPQILMLSGVGPKEHLEEVGIDVIQDSPGVGQNLQAHVTSGGFPYLYDPPTTAAPATNATTVKIPGYHFTTVAEVNKFLYNKTGALYNFFGGQGHGFISSGLANSSLDYPDIQLILGSSGENVFGGLISKRNYGIQEWFANILYGSIATNTSYQIFPQVLRPKSKGYVKLRSSNPYYDPVIVPNHFNDSADMDLLVRAFQIVYQLSQTTAMKKVNARPNPNPTPGCGYFNVTSHAFLECHIRRYTLTSHHPTSTCKMGPASDAMAVVDSSLKVYNVSGLRVVDASVMPSITSGNTHAPTVMIAEKAADMIKKDHSVAAS